MAHISLYPPAHIPPAHSPPAHISPAHISPAHISPAHISPALIPRAHLPSAHTSGLLTSRLFSSHLLTSRLLTTRLLNHHTTYLPRHSKASLSAHVNVNCYGSGTLECTAATILTLALQSPSNPYLDGTLIVPGHAMNDKGETDWERTLDEAIASAPQLLEAWQQGTHHILHLPCGHNGAEAGNDIHLVMAVGADGARARETEYATKSHFGILTQIASRLTPGACDGELTIEQERWWSNVETPGRVDRGMSTEQRRRWTRSFEPFLLDVRTEEVIPSADSTPLDPLTPSAPLPRSSHSTHPASLRSQYGSQTSAHPSLAHW